VAVVYLHIVQHLAERTVEHSLTTDQGSEKGPNTNESYQPLKRDHTNENYQLLKRDHTNENYQLLKRDHTNENYQLLKRDHTNENYQLLKRDHTNENYQLLKRDHTNENHKLLKRDHSTAQISTYIRFLAACQLDLIASRESPLNSAPCISFRNLSSDFRLKGEKYKEH
jgi:phosphatidate phosphatase APP1